MAKKFLLTTIFALLLVLSLATISFAKVDNTTTTLGDEVTSSMNKTEKNMDELGNSTGLDRAGQAVENGARTVGETVKDGMDSIGRGVEDLVDEDDDRTNNTTVAGTTRNYGAGQIQAQDTQTGRNGMSQNAWIWIVMVVVALVIVAAVWFYAAQKD